MSNIIINPDIHGRQFWVDSAKHIDDVDKVIFLGDYFDPYGFEEITVEDAIENFKKILEFKKSHINKVVLLLGNHDLPYIYDDYYRFSHWHCRHSKKYHNEIHQLFNDNIALFSIAHVADDVLFTHAGVESGWLENVVKFNSSDINEICNKLNTLTQDKDGLASLFCISSQRGGIDKYASCVWADVRDIWLSTNNNSDTKQNPTQNIKQVFGHTMQAFYNKDGIIEFGEPFEFGNCKMVDCAKSFILNTDKFTIKSI